MNKIRRGFLVGTLGLGVSLTALTGCQTNVAGMTLPSGHYLQHPPQYIPPSPPFPLSRELAQMEGAAANAPGIAPAAAPPVPAVPQLVPQPAPARAPGAVPAP